MLVTFGTGSAGVRYRYGTVYRYRYSRWSIGKFYIYLTIPYHTIHLPWLAKDFVCRYGTSTVTAPFLQEFLFTCLGQFLLKNLVRKNLKYRWFFSIWIYCSFLFNKIFKCPLGIFNTFLGLLSGSFYNHAKIVRKPLIPTILWLFLTFYLWKMM